MATDKTASTTIPNEAVMPTKAFVWIDNLSVSGFIY